MNTGLGFSSLFVGSMCGVLAACSGTDLSSSRDPGGGRGGTAARGAAPDGGLAPDVCGTATGGGDSRIVGAGISGSDLVLLRANGERSVAASFAVPAGAKIAGTSVLTKDGRVTAALSWLDGGTVWIAETIRLNEQFEVLWDVPVSADLVSDAGAAVNGTGFVLANKTTVTYQNAADSLSVTFRDPPDKDGWMHAWWTPTHGTGNSAGMVNVDGRIRPLASLDASTNYSEALLAGQYVLLYRRGDYSVFFDRKGIRPQSP